MSASAACGEWARGALRSPTPGAPPPGTPRSKTGRRGRALWASRPQRRGRDAQRGRGLQRGPANQRPLSRSSFGIALPSALYHRCLVLLSRMPLLILIGVVVALWGVTSLVRHVQEKTRYSEWLRASTEQVLAFDAESLKMKAERLTVQMEWVVRCDRSITGRNAPTCPTTVPIHLPPKPPSTRRSRASAQEHNVQKHGKRRRRRR